MKETGEYILPGRNIEHYFIPILRLRSLSVKCKTV